MLGHVFEPHVPEISSEHSRQFSACTLRMIQLSTIGRQIPRADVGARHIIFHIINLGSHPILNVEMYCRYFVSTTQKGRGFMSHRFKQGTSSFSSMASAVALWYSEAV